MGLFQDLLLMELLQHYKRLKAFTQNLWEVLIKLILENKQPQNFLVY